MSIREVTAYLFGGGSIAGVCAGKGGLRYSLWVMGNRVARGWKAGRGDRFSWVVLIDVADAVAASEDAA
jgi:hypothetical protein